LVIFIFSINLFILNRNILYMSCTISTRFKILPCFNVDVGGGGEDAAVAAEAATRLLIALSIFANASSTLTKTS
jgi:hypothetical protein